MWAVKYEEKFNLNAPHEYYRPTSETDQPIRVVFLSADATTCSAEDNISIHFHEELAGDVAFNMAI